MPIVFNLIRKNPKKMKKLILLFLVLSVYTQAHAQEGNFANVNGVEIYYEVHGEGEPLVMIHGFTLNHTMWDQFIEDFSENFKVILVDIRGHGKSTNPTNNFTHKESAKDIYGLMDTLQIDSFKGIGFSSGGMALTHMATMDSTRIEAMVLIGSTSFFPEPAREILRSINFDAIHEDWMNRLKQDHVSGVPQIRNIITQWKSVTNSYDDMNFTPPYLSTIKAQTLIIHGDRDPFFPIDIPVTSYKNIPNSYLWVVPNFGHQGFDIAGDEKDPIWADTYVTVVKQFLSGEWDE